jgi:hypothetical protein
MVEDWDDLRAWVANSTPGVIVPIRIDDIDALLAAYDALIEENDRLRVSVADRDAHIKILGDRVRRLRGL